MLRFQIDASTIYARLLYSFRRAKSPAFSRTVFVMQAAGQGDLFLVRWLSRKGELKLFYESLSIVIFWGLRRSDTTHQAVMIAWRTAAPPSSMGKTAAPNRLQVQLPQSPLAEFSSCLAYQSFFFAVASLVSRIAKTVPCSSLHSIALSRLRSQSATDDTALSL
jgi:hypothetical protein